MRSTRENRKFSKWNASPGCPTAGSVKDDFFHGQPRSPGLILAGTYGLLEGAAGIARRPDGGQNCGESASDEGSDRSDPRDKIGQQVDFAAFFFDTVSMSAGRFCNPSEMTAGVRHRFPDPRPAALSITQRPPVVVHLAPAGAIVVCQMEVVPGGIAWRTS